MIDLYIENNAIYLDCDPLLFQGFAERCAANKRIEKVYGEYGDFKTEKHELGFNGCLKLAMLSDQHLVYMWNFPKQIPSPCSCSERGATYHCFLCDDSRIHLSVDHFEVKRFLATMHIISDYEIRIRFSDPKDAPKQNFCLDLNCRYDGVMRPSIGGYLYPPLVKFLKTRTNEQIAEIEKYVKTETQHIYDYMWGRKIKCVMTKISQDSFYVCISGDATSLSTDRDCSLYEGKISLIDHNVFNAMDQFILASSLINLNTFYRKQVKHD